MGLREEAEAMRRIFGKTMPRVARVRIVLSKKYDTLHKGGRTCASTREDGLEMVLSPELMNLPPETRAAILAHEFGHAADFLYPGAWMNDGQGGTLAAWRKRSRDEIERAADQIAEGATGRPIAYGGSRMLQSFSCGTRPRPLGLR